MVDLGNRKQLDAKKLHELLARDIAVEVASGRLPPSASLPPEKTLAEQYGVSRPVVRTAIQELASAGLVRIRHGKRTLVLPRDEWDILSELSQYALQHNGRTAELVRDLYEARLQIEPQVAALAAGKATDQDRADLTAIMERMKTAHAQRESDAGNRAFMLTGRAFHAAIGQATHNLVMAAVMRTLHKVDTVGWAQMVFDADDIDAMFDQHSAIAKALFDSSTEAAAAAMREHLEWSMHQALAALKEER